MNLHVYHPDWNYGHEHCNRCGISAMDVVNDEPRVDIDKRLCTPNADLVAHNEEVFAPVRSIVDEVLKSFKRK